MNRPIRVMVVDDAVIVRRMIALTLAQDPAFDVVATPSGGEVALRTLEKTPVDIVTLDLDMPVMDGKAVLQQIRARWPQVLVVMFTGTIQPGSAELEALGLGASDCISKLPHEGNMRGAMEWITGRLAPRLKELVKQNTTAPITPRAAVPPRAVLAASAPSRRRSSRPEVLVVGASTGGPNALEAFLAALPPDFPLPILVVQHMPEGFTRLLADRLCGHTPFAAAEAVGGKVPSAGEVWIAPGGRHLSVRRNGATLELQLTADPPENSCRPAVDVLFRSAAENCGSATLAVVLTGMGQDGLIGAQAIVKAGGDVLVQDEASSVVWGMPGAIARAGIAGQVLPLVELAGEVGRRARTGPLAATPH